MRLARVLMVQLLRAHGQARVTCVNVTGSRVSMLTAFKGRQELILI